MITQEDKRYFEMSFAHQMALIDEEVECLLLNDEKYNTVAKIREKGKESYGKAAGTRAIMRLFTIALADPKNTERISELTRAESQLIAFLYGEPGAPSKEHIYSYWNKFLWMYVDEAAKKE